jgi:uncharacterized protein (DUF305 family)
MVLFSRSFIRKRVLSLATTASVTATSFALAQDPTSVEAVHSQERPFLSESIAFMRKMTADVMIKPSGDVDRDFVAMMVPHHQGAVDMAKAELKYGHNEQLLQLAREIVANQQQEIKKMRGAIGDDGSSTASPERAAAHGAISTSP